MLSSKSLRKYLSSVSQVALLTTGSETEQGERASARFKLAFHDSDTSDTRDFLARKSASWDAGFIASPTRKMFYFLTPNVRNVVSCRLLLTNGNKIYAAFSSVGPWGFSRIQ